LALRLLYAAVVFSSPALHIPVDFSHLLLRQLTRIESLAVRIQRTKDRHVRLAAYRELCDRGALHVYVREHLVFPLLRNIKWKGLTSETLAVHARFKAALAELVVCRPDQDGFTERLQAFVNRTLCQHDEDSQVLVPALREAADLSERRALCHEIELVYQRLAGYDPAPHAMHPRDLLDEAGAALAALRAAQARAREAGGEDG